MRTKLTDKEYNLLTTWTSRVKVDSVLDVVPVSDEEDGIMDFENDTILSLEEGLSELEGCIAYPFEHEGFSKEESKILENLFSEFTGTKFAD